MAPVRETAGSSTREGEDGGVHPAGTKPAVSRRSAIPADLKARAAAHCRRVRCDAGLPPTIEDPAAIAAIADALRVDPVVEPRQAA